MRSAFECPSPVADLRLDELVIEPFAPLAHPEVVDSPSDAELVSNAQAGDAAAFGALVMRHRASMLAVAFGILGHRPEAEDAVQDAVMAALARVAELRDASVAGAWLRAIVRNNCLMILRRRPRAVSLDRLADVAPGPDEVLERHALQSWVLHALNTLSEPLQLTLLLRYFTNVTSYQDIATLSGVPIGTVRSRLAEAKRKIAEMLLFDASARYGEIDERSALRARQTAHCLAEAEQGRFSRFATELFEPDLRVVGPTLAWGTDLRFLVHALNSDREAGVRHVVRNVISGSRITIWEMDLVSPPTDPTHCPPSIVWAHFTPNGRTSRLHLFHAPR